MLELAQVVAGPFCGALMAEFGAEVIKTEMPGRGDDLRRLGPTEDGCTYWFAVDNRNKKLMTLDLHVPRAERSSAGSWPSATSCSRTSGRACSSAGASTGTPSMRSIRGWSWRGSRVPSDQALNQGPGYAAIGSAFGGTWYQRPADRPARARRRSTPTT